MVTNTGLKELSSWYSYIVFKALDSVKFSVQSRASKVHCPASSVRIPASSGKHPESRVQSPESGVQRLESRVQHQSLASRVQSPVSRVQCPESSMQSPVSRVQCPASNFCVQSTGILVYLTFHRINSTGLSEISLNQMCSTFGDIVSSFSIHCIGKIQSSGKRKFKNGINLKIPFLT